MPIDVDTKNSPGWWLQRLSRQMHARPTRTSDTGAPIRSRAERMDLLHRYLIGDPPLPKSTDSHSRFTRDFLRMARANYALLIVDAMLDRTSFLGVSTVQDNDADGDDLARRIAAANGWGALTQDVHSNTFALSEGYVIVGAPDEDTGLPLVTAQDPRNVITAHDPVRPNRSRAALNLYRDDDEGRDVAHVYTPGRVDVAYRDGGSSLASPRFAARSWEWAGAESGSYPVAGAESVVPVVRFKNRLGMGEYEPHLDLLNRINEMISDRLWIAKYQTFRQRGLKSDELPDAYPEGHPQAGQEVDYDEIFEADPGSFWKLPKDAEMWESQQTDLRPVLDSVKEDRQELAAITRTPLYYMNPDAANGSAEGASLQREGAVFKAKDRQERLTANWLSVYRYAFLFAGDEARARSELTAMWAPAERYSLAERGDAAAKGKASGVPQRSVLTDLWQFDPPTVARMERERAGDLLFQAPGQAVPTDG